MTAPEKEPRVWWTRLVREASSITGPARAVLYFLADVADADGVSFYAQRKIALGAGVTDRTVRTVMKALEADGLIVVGSTPDGYRAPSVRLVESALVKRKDVPGGKTFRAEGRSGGVGKTFRGSRKDVPVEAEGRSYKEPKEEPIEDPSEVTRADGVPPLGESAQPVPDDRPSHPALSPVDATADGRTGDGEGFPLAHAPTPPAALRGSDASDGGGEPAQGKRKRRAAQSSVTPDELDAFGRILAAWDAVGGKRQRLDPEAGVGSAVLARIRDIGEQAMCDRIAGLRLDPSGYWPAALEGRGLDARGNPRPALTIEAVARVGTPGDWLSERQAAGAQARLEEQASAPRDWRPTLEAWSTAERHPGLDHKADWIRALAAACALGARGDWSAVCAWLREPAHREAVATALGAPPVEQDAPAGADAWADMLPRMKSPSRMLAPWQPRGPRLAADDAEHGRRAAAWRGGLWVRWCGASDDAERREIAGLWRATYAGAVVA